METGFQDLETDEITGQIIGAARFADLPVGLLFNFNVDVLAVGGWKRVL